MKWFFKLSLIAIAAASIAFTWGYHYIETPHLTTMEAVVRYWPAWLGAISAGLAGAAIR